MYVTYDREKIVLLIENKEHSPQIAGKKPRKMLVDFQEKKQLKKKEQSNISPLNF